MIDGNEQFCDESEIVFTYDSTKEFDLSEGDFVIIEIPINAIDTISFPP